MGGIEVGLKQGSFRGLGLGLRQGIQQQEQSHYNARNAVVLDSGDYSFADQFLNLQTATDSNIQQEDLQVDNKDSVFLPPPPPPLQSAQTEVDFCSALTLPEEEGELEWLSQFMEDSFSQPYPESPNPNKKRKGRAGPTPGWAKVARTCSHCGTQKTPQWRVGPTGEKTLCNACGMRFKTGRLLPEYRPANSPTFSEDIHASSHKKVLEMRKKNKP